MTALLIDADILVYRAVASVEREIEWEPDVWTMVTDLNEARDAFSEMLMDLSDKVPNTKFSLCFSDRLNFRKDLYPDYKSNRSNQRKPMGFKVFRDEVIEKYKGIIKPTLEADDVIGILATKPDADYIIYSGDKDLKQIPGKHLVDGQVITITKEEGDKFHMLQTLTGDAVDGYPGCPGIGKVKAQRILESIDDWSLVWETVVDVYDKAGLTEEDALVQARMARILQWENWNKDQQEVIHWKPTKRAHSLKQANILDRSSTTRQMPALMEAKKSN